MRRPLRDPAESQHAISRRALFLGGAQLAFMGVLGLRMRWMQLEQADEFRLLAEENRINIRLIPPDRGLITDRNGHTLAANEQNYRIVIVREDAGDYEATIARLAKIVELEPAELERATRELKQFSPFVPVTVADRLSWDEIAKVAVNIPALPGVTPEVGLSRYYPRRKDFAHVVGYVGPVSDFDLSKIENPDPLLRIPRFQLGKVGLEARLESDLRGRAGTRRIEVNAAGRIMRELDRQPGIPGQDVQLTLDARLQNFAQARLDGHSASAVVMDVETGEIHALASAPSFDPNSFVRGISVKDYNSLTGDNFRPLANKTVQGTYPPGSTFKMVVALAALAEGLIEPDEDVFCGGFKELGNRRFHCWRRGGHGKVNMEEALTQSCDVYFYDIAERVGIEKITEMARKLGLGVRHDIPLSGIAAGLTPTKDWKRRNYDQDWLVGDTFNAGIGQGFVLASPIQLAVMTARIASGTSVLPQMVRSTNGVDVTKPRAQPLDIDPLHLQIVRQGMSQVVNHQRGTAFSSRTIADELRIAGKTGTSQVRNITTAEREAGVAANEDLPWDRRDHALFVSFAPADTPKYACTVVVEHGGGGSSVAAPIARDIMLFALYGERPPLTAYPANQRGTIQSLFEEIELDDFSSPTAGGSARI